MHVFPSPVNPSLHVQRYDPGRLTQSAFTSQSSISLVHSLISVEQVYTRALLTNTIRFDEVTQLYLNMLTLFQHIHLCMYRDLLVG